MKAHTVLPNETPDPLDLETACHNEAQRRLRMLGDLATKDASRKLIRHRAREVFVDPDELETWYRAYQKLGLEGLKPDWPLPNSHTQQVVRCRLHALGALAEQEYVDSEDIQSLAKENGWHFSSAWRWLRRYRSGGLLGLAPAKQVTKHPRDKPDTRVKRSPGDVSEDELQEAYRRYDSIRDLADKRHVSKKEVEEHASKVGFSARTIRYRLSAYRADGLIGLIPEERADKGQTHNLSSRMQHIIRGVRLTNRNSTVRSVHQEACKRAEKLGEKAPSLWQVRTVIKSIPEPILLLADGRNRDFRNKYRFTFFMRFEGVVWQIDQTPVDSLAADIRKPGYRTKGGEKRIYLTAVIECNSRRILAARFGYEPANRFNVAAVLREAILVGGIPDEIWTDHGEEFKSRHVAALLQEFKINVQAKDRAELKGRIERVFQTFNEQLWREIPGYVGSNTTQRHPDKRPKLTIAQLEGRFWKYLDEEYHQQPHSELPEKEPEADGMAPVNMTPMEYWNEYCFAETISPRRLDVFLKDACTGKVGKRGIKHHRRKYWHEELSNLVGETVRIRAKVYDYGPEEVEVFHNGTWICTAFAHNSARGQRVTGHEVARAQRVQRLGYRSHINDYRGRLRQVDKSLPKDNPPKGTPQQAKQVDFVEAARQPEPKQDHSSHSSPPSNPPGTKPGSSNRKKSFLERMSDDTLDELFRGDGA